MVRRSALQFKPFVRIVFVHDTAGASKQERQHAGSTFMRPAGRTRVVVRHSRPRQVGGPIHSPKEVAMSINRRILAVLGARYPAVYDIIPRWYLGIVQDRLSELNPQPLPPFPPHELGAVLAAEFVHTAWQAERFGLDPALALRDLEDWCPTPPRWPKLPPWLLPIPEPQPRPNWHLDFHLGFASRLALASEQMSSAALRDIADKAIERSIQAIESATPG